MDCPTYALLAILKYDSETSTSVTDGLFCPFLICIQLEGANYIETRGDNGASTSTLDPLAPKSMSRRTSRRPGPSFPLTGSHNLAVFRAI